MKNKTKSMLICIGLAYVLGFSFVIGLTFFTAMTNPNKEILVTIDSYNEGTIEVVFIILGIIPIGYFVYDSIKRARKLWFNQQGEINDKLSDM